MLRIANKITKFGGEAVRTDIRHFSTNSGQGNTGTLCPTTDPKVLEGLVDHSKNAAKKSAQQLWDSLSKETKNTFGKNFQDSNVTSLQTTPNANISNPRGFSTATKVASIG